MYNSPKFKFGIGADMSYYDKTRVDFTASDFLREDMENLIEVMQRLGLNVQAEFSKSGKTARIKVRDLPSKWDAEVARTRRAGRKSQGIHPPAGSIFNSETPCKEFLEWQESHTASEGMEQLGLARSTYFRRTKAIREAVVEQERVNAARDKSPEWRGKPRYTATLGGVR